MEFIGFVDLELGGDCGECDGHFEWEKMNEYMGSLRPSDCL